MNAPSHEVESAIASSSKRKLALRSTQKIDDDNIITQRITRRIQVRNVLFESSCVTSEGCEAPITPFCWVSFEIALAVML